MVLKSIITTTTLTAILFFQASAQKITTEDYILLYKDIAIAEMKRTGIPASIKLAQGILESASGNSRLALKANNHFGIKCHGEWTGEKILHDDDHPGECFRVYSKPEESFFDHSNFLVSRKRYADLFQLSSTDYKGWAMGLKNAGYATNKNYDKILIQLIERYQLYLYDEETQSGKTFVQTNLKNISANQAKETGGYSPEQAVVDIYTIKRGEINRVEYVVAEKGDTWQSLTKKYNKLPWELYRYNDISREMSAEIFPGQIIYLQPKRRKADINYKYHIVKEGETLWSISQKYAIKLKHLKRLNRLTGNETPEVGTKLYLRRKKPKS